MVMKLMKHEFFALFRVLIYVSAVVLVLSVLARVALALEQFEFTIISMVFSIYGIAVLMVCAWAVSVNRFYRSLFTGEGYLTFSLPATPSQILIAKLLSAIATMFVSAIISGIAIVIIFSGIDFDAIFEGMGVTAGELIDGLGAYLSSDPLIVVEEVVSLIVSIPLSLLFLYSVICVGQLFTKHRKLFAFLIGLAVYFVASLVSSYAEAGFFEEIAAMNPHLLNWIEIVVVFALDAGMFFFVRYVMRNKVNLIV